MFPLLYLLVLGIYSISAANVTIDDADSARTYSPPQFWNAIAGGSCNGCAFHPDTNQTYDQTWNETSGPQDSASIPFNGTAFEVYGLCGLWPANYTLILDGAYNGTYLKPGCPANAFQYNLLIYAGKNIAPTTHTVELINQRYQFQYGGQEYASDLIIDYLVYDGVASPSPTANHSSTSNPSSQSSSVPLARVIPPIAVAVVATVILAFWLGRRYSRRRAGLAGRDDTFTTDGPSETPTQRISQEVLSTRVTPMAELDHGRMRYQPSQSPQRAVQPPSTHHSLLQSGADTSRKSRTSAEGAPLDHHPRSLGVHTSMSESHPSYPQAVPSSPLLTHTLAGSRALSPGLADVPPSYGDVMLFP